MQRHYHIVLIGLLLCATCGLTGARALASSGPGITATNVTMPSSGNGTSQYTITGIPGNGTVIIGCVFSGTITDAKIPFCGGGPIDSIAVTAGQTLTGTITIYPFGAAVPVGLRKAPRAKVLPATGLALAGVLMLGFGFRRKFPRWLLTVLLAAGALAGASGISGCGGISKSMTSMTPGTYQYTVDAAYQDTATPILSAILETNIEVTVQ
ncbi:MAG: hypothetical protein ABR907_08680 [Terracidiphilus sp.]|jgi:hypothetical protein